MSQVLGDLCLALLLKHFEFVLRGPARLEGAGCPPPLAFAAPLRAWLSPAAEGALPACGRCRWDLKRGMLLFGRQTRRQQRQGELVFVFLS